MVKQVTFTLFYLSLVFYVVSSLSVSSKDTPRLSGFSQFNKHVAVITCLSGLILTGCSCPTYANPTNIYMASSTCISGVGDACANLAEGNALIQELQRRSAKNKEQAQQDFLNSYNMKNFPDYFASMNPPKFLVKKVSSDGTSSFILMDDGELQQLKKGGKIQVEVAKAMGGRVVDMTTKPMLVWKDY